MQSVTYSNDEDNRIHPFTYSNDEDNIICKMTATWPESSVRTLPQKICFCRNGKLNSQTAISTENSGFSTKKHHVFATSLLLSPFDLIEPCHSSPQFTFTHTWYYLVHPWCSNLLRWAPFLLQYSTPSLAIRNRHFFIKTLLVHTDFPFLINPKFSQFFSWTCLVFFGYTHHGFAKNLLLGVHRR